jgi:ribonuclease HII
MYDNTEIDEVNILNASIYSMHRALDKLKIIPQHIIVDGNRFKPYRNIPHTTIIKGDEQYLSIAAASVLAKTYRDDYMDILHQEYPCYGWLTNKGYPTMFHRQAIGEAGICCYHRKTFGHNPDQYRLDFE